MRMAQFRDPLLILALSLNFVALGVSSLRTAINAIALQGALLGVLVLFVHHKLDVRTVFLVAATLALKGIAIPGLLFRAMREVDVQREVTPLVPYLASLLLGAAGTTFAIVFANTLPLAQEHAGQLLVPASLATVLTGFLLLTCRRKAIMQVLGYLVLENGILLFGLLLLDVVPFLVEVGVLLDLFTGVFVMGIIIHHINRAFDSESTEHLSELRE
jgi:hydrogenase-4 component E